MKKILLILFLFLSCNVFSQSLRLNKLQLQDSIYPVTGANIRINASAYYLNGVLQSFSGGGFDSVAFLSTYHTWTKNFGMTTGLGFLWNSSSIKSTSDTILLQGKSLKFRNTAGAYVMRVDSVGNVIFTGNITGSYDASQLTGDIDDARLSDNVAGLTTSISGDNPQIMTLQTNFTNTQNIYYGKGYLLDSLRADSIKGGTLNNARLNSNIAIIGTNLDTTKLFYRRDTAGYFTRYNLDTTQIADTTSVVRKTSGITQTINSIINFVVTAIATEFYVNSARTIKFILPNLSSSDSAMSINAYQTPKNKSFDTTSSGFYRMIIVNPATVNTFLTNTTYYFGAFNTLGLNTTESYNKIQMPFNCTIIRANIQMIPTTGYSDADSISLKLKRYGSVSSDTASYTITNSGALTTSVTQFNYQANMNISITAGDFVQFILTTRQQATSPNATYIQGKIIFK